MGRKTKHRAFLRSGKRKKKSKRRKKRKRK
jgi:hypothetical protein